MARARRPTRRPIFWRPRKKLADLDLPHKSQDESVPRGVSEVSPYFDIDESIFGLSFIVSSRSEVVGTPEGPSGE